MLQSTGSRVIAMRSVTLAVLATGLIAGPTLAQTGSPAPKAKAKTEAKAQSEAKAPKKSLHATTRISNSPHPTYDAATDTANVAPASIKDFRTHALTADNPEDVRRHLSAAYDALGWRAAA